MGCVWDCVCNIAIAFGKCFILPSIVPAGFNIYTQRCLIPFHVLYNFIDPKHTRMIKNCNLLYPASIVAENNNTNQNCRWTT